MWFGASLLLWTIDFAVGTAATRFLFSSPSSNYSVALGIWGLVEGVVLTPLVGYFVQGKVKTFDLYGILVMTVAAGLAVTVGSQSIVLSCTTSTPYTCTYLFGPGLNGNLPNVLAGFAGALNVSFAILVGAFLCQRRHGAIGTFHPTDRRYLTLAASLAIGFLAVGTGSVAAASTNVIFPASYLISDPTLTLPRWYGQLMRLLSGPVLAVCLGYLLHKELGAIDIKGLFSMVALGGLLAFLSTQVAYGITLSRVSPVIVGAFDTGIFTAWIVLCGYFLSMLEKEGDQARIGA